MQIEREECENAAFVLEQAKNALLTKDALKLRDLSDRTIHSSCFYQDSGSITSAVLIYTLSKLIERADYKRIRFWNKFERKCASAMDLAIDSIRKGDQGKYVNFLEKARKLLESTAGNLKPYIKEVINKASINKASKMYDHGISLEQTSKLLGISQWELLEYVGQRSIPDNPYNETISVEKRAKLAVDFFS